MDFTKPEIKLEIKKLCEILGKCGDDMLAATAKSYGWKIPGKLDALKDCVIGKAKQKLISRNQTPIEKQYIDIVLIKGRGFGSPVNPD